MNGLYVDFPVETLRLSLTQLDAAPPLNPLAAKSGWKLRQSENDSMFD